MLIYKNKMLPTRLIFYINQNNPYNRLGIYMKQKFFYEIESTSIDKFTLVFILGVLTGLKSKNTIYR